MLDEYICICMSGICYEGMSDSFISKAFTHTATCFHVCKCGRVPMCVCVWVGAFSSTSVSLHIHFHCKFYQHPICAAVCVYVRDTEQIIRNTVTA